MNITNKFIISIGLVLIFFTLSACEQTEQSHENLKMEKEESKGNIVFENNQQNISYSFKNPNTGQEFNIVHAYLLYDNYFETVKQNPDESHHKLFEREIIEPVYDACFKDAELYKFRIFEWIPKESDFNNIKKLIESMDQDHLNNLYEEALVKSSDILSSDKKTNVCVFPKNERFPSDMANIGPGRILVFYNNFDNSYTENELDGFNKSGMSHEYHHSVWTEKHFTEDYFMTLLDYLIMEGGGSDV